jgi:uncharacterized UBP type Zn finger protein
MSACAHLEPFLAPHRAPVHPASNGCQECLETGDPWVHLRLCLACGHVGCCDDSPNRHATGHFHATAHPVMKSFEPGEDWAWCYVDGKGVKAIPRFPEESPPHHLSPPGREA